MNISKSGVPENVRYSTLAVIYYGVISSSIVYLLWILMHIRRFRFIRKSFGAAESNLLLELLLASLLIVPLFALILGILFAIRWRET